MATIELDRADLARGVRDAIDTLRQATLHDVVENYLSRVTAGMYWSGYGEVVRQAELQAWTMWRASCTAQPTHVR